MATTAPMSEIFEAAYAGDTAQVGALLDNGADPNERLDNNVTLLIIASARGHIDMMQALIDHGADINAKNKFGFNPVLAAVSQEKADAVRLLVEKGAALDEILPGTGDTALMDAVNKNNADILRLLIDGFADLGVRKSNGYTALELAEQCAHQDIKQLLRDAPARQAQLIWENSDEKRLADMHARTARRQESLLKSRRQIRLKI